MIGSSPLALLRRARAWLAAIPPRGCAMAGAALVLSAWAIIYLLGWPPIDQGGWRHAALPIALAAITGWALLVRAFILTPGASRPGASRVSAAKAMRPASYRDIVVYCVHTLIRRLASFWLVLAGVVFGLSALYDALAALAGAAPLFAATARGLVFLAKLATDPLLMSAFAIVSLAALAIDLAARLWPADEETVERFSLVAIADPVVSTYRDQLRRLGRRFIAEDRECLGAHLEMDRSFRDRNT